VLSFESGPSGHRPYVDVAAVADAATDSDHEWPSSLVATRSLPACVIQIERREGCVDYRFIAVSPAFEDCTGLEDAVGHTMRELHPDHEQFWFDLYEGIEATGEASHFEHPARALNRVFRGFAFRIGHPGAHRVVVVFENLGEESRMARFGATLAHELRGPLAPLANGLHILKSCTRDEPRVAQTLAMMDRQFHQLSALVEDLMDVGGFRCANVQARLETVNLHHVVSEAVEACSSSLDARRQDLAIDCDGQDLVVRGDPLRLRQVFTNLLANSVKYTPPGGHIAIRFAREGATAVVEIRDDGAGISAKELPHVFELFKQGEPRLSTRKSGLGIGLSVVKDIVQMHGGTVEARSPGRGCGSTFIVRLPLS
jgi:signal transduction histidine kinase